MKRKNVYIRDQIMGGFTPISKEEFEAGCAEDSCEANVSIDFGYAIVNILFWAPLGASDERSTEEAHKYTEYVTNITGFEMALSDDFED